MYNLTFILNEYNYDEVLYFGKTKHNLFCFLCRIWRLHSQGIINKIISDQIENDYKCLNPEQHVPNNLVALKLNDFYAVFSIYLTGE